MRICCSLSIVLTGFGEIRANLEQGGYIGGSYESLLTICDFLATFLDLGQP
jgi:hypothetical protein